MRKYKSALRPVLEDVFCDICGKSCSSECSMGDPTMLEYATLEVFWGYCSRKDGDNYSCEMCESCFDKIKSFIDSIRAG